MFGPRPAPPPDRSARRLSCPAASNTTPRDRRRVPHTFRAQARKSAIEERKRPKLPDRLKRDPSYSRRRPVRRFPQTTNRFVRAGRRLRNKTESRIHVRCDSPAPRSLAEVTPDESCRECPRPRTDPIVPASVPPCPARMRCTADRTRCPRLRSVFEIVRLPEIATIFFSVVSPKALRRGGAAARSRSTEADTFVGTRETERWTSPPRLHRDDS